MDNVHKISNWKIIYYLFSHFFTLRMETAGSSEILVYFYQTTWRHIPGDINILSVVQFAVLDANVRGKVECVLLMFPPRNAERDVPLRWVGGWGGCTSHRLFYFSMVQKMSVTETEVYPHTHADLVRCQLRGRVRCFSVCAGGDLQ
jgi:hypothetical protein